MMKHLKGEFEKVNQKDQNEITLSVVIFVDFIKIQVFTNVQE